MPNDLPQYKVTPEYKHAPKIKARMPAYIFEVWNISKLGKMATRGKRKNREKRHPQLHVCYAFIEFCPNAVCVLNICCSPIKILNNHFILLLG